MKILTADEMRATDRLTTEQYGIPSTSLMENAGESVARFIAAEFSAAKRQQWWRRPGRRDGSRPPGVSGQDPADRIDRPAQG
jgi:hypothetical protein